jgi:2-amino-4-hydroxy-6-hydroxymethyldihydropteridine diphosphokinase
MREMKGILSLCITFAVTMNQVFLCIGGNLGNREENLAEALMFIDFNFGDVVRTSAIYESPAWGMTNAPAFLNQVVEIKTKLDALALLQEIDELEEFFGRERKSGVYLNREMDVDILLFNQETIDLPKLQVPHPRMHERRFVLVPLAELVPDYSHPTLNQTIAQLLEKCEDKSAITKR